MNSAPKWDPKNPFPELGEDADLLKNLQPIIILDSQAGVSPLPIYANETIDTNSQNYLRLGNVTSADLLSGEIDRFTHLDGRLAQTVEWVQKYLSENGWVERILDARLLGDTSKEYSDVAAEIDRLALQYVSRDSIAHGVDLTYIVAATIDEILGLGPIEPLMRDDSITEVMVNAPNQVFVEISGKEYFVPGARFRSQEHLLEVCQRIVRPIGRSIDQRSAYVDARLPDGSRVNIVHQTLAATGPIITIRKFPDKTWTIVDLLEYRSIDEDMACVLAWLVRNRVNILVAGGTGSGKTSLLNALSGSIPRGQRTITIEDSRELQLHPDSHWVALEARSASSAGEGGVTIRDLVRNALRMRPVRIIVGEVRGAEALDMLNAMNTGHEGSLSTIHANGPRETVDRLLTMIAMGGEMTSDLASRLIASAIDIIIFQEKGVDGVRRITSISEVLKPGYGAIENEVTLSPLWLWKQDGFNDDGYVVGHYAQNADISEGLSVVRRLEYADPVTIEDVYKMSELPA